jgi:hypothetical protein
MFNQNFKATPRTARIHYGEVATSIQSSQVGLVAEFVQRAPDGKRKLPIPVALLVCHGMGEQVRFETIGQISASLLKEAVAEGCTVSETGVELSFQNESFLARAELNWMTPEGNAHAVHVYEAYWAPVTEGQVTYWETVSFLFSAAWKGLSSSKLFKPYDFQRYLFGRLRNLTIYSRTKVALLCVAVVLIAQVTAIAVVLAKLVDQLKQLETAHFAIKQILEVLLPGIHLLRSATASPGQKLPVVLTLLSWYLLVAEILAARYFIIEYVGDVAAYISPYKASKFDDIRTKIQAIGLNVAKVIYGFGNTSVVPNYERVVFAGHSLGSVLAYDTLNATINLDLTSAMPGSKHVVERTTKLITFGSPLDKTAFLFRNQSNHVKDPLREQMVSAFQPLILNYATFRKPYFWTNLWSPLDVISGSLEYYDVPVVAPGEALDPAETLGAGYPREIDDPRRIENLRDPAATIPLAAHVQYWTGDLLAKTLYAAVKHEGG